MVGDLKRAVPPGAKAVHTRRVDISEQTFADEAVKQLDYLQGYGFKGPDVEHGAGNQTTISVRYQKGQMILQVSLEVLQPREHYVVLTGLVNDGERDMPHYESRDRVRTGRQMRRTLQRLARSFRATMVAPD